MRDNMPKNLFFILVGPSGVGKSTFLDRVLKDFDNICDIVTFTSRKKRTGEKEGSPYHFVTRDMFLSLIDEKFFIEWAEVHGNLYGTPRAQIEGAWKKGLGVIMDLDIQGARAMAREYPQAVTVFIHPPSIDELRQRVIKREGSVTSDLEVRMKNAQREISLASECKYQLVNIDLEVSYKELKKLIEETLKPR
jgi:guanylate kinase